MANHPRVNASFSGARIAALVFWIGAVGDGLLALYWFGIAAGFFDGPTLLAGFAGPSTPPYRLALGIAALFMAAWTALLYWGSRRPIERRGVLLLTAIFMALGVLADGWAFHSIFRDLYSPPHFLYGQLFKLYVVIQFAFAYVASRPERPSALAPSGAFS